MRIKRKLYSDLSTAVFGAGAVNSKERREEQERRVASGGNAVGTAGMIGATGLGAYIGAKMEGNKALVNSHKTDLMNAAKSSPGGLTNEVEKKITDQVKTYKTDVVKGSSFGQKWNMKNSAGKTPFRKAAIGGGFGGALAGLGIGMMANQMMTDHIKNKQRQQEQ